MTPKSPKKRKFSKLGEVVSPKPLKKNPNKPNPKETTQNSKQKKSVQIFVEESNLTQKSSQSKIKNILTTNNKENLVKVNYLFISFERYRKRLEKT